MTSNIEERLSTPTYQPLCAPHHDTHLRTGCWRCPSPNGKQVSPASLLCPECIEELRG